MHFLIEVQKASGAQIKNVSEQTRLDESRKDYILNEINKLNEYFECLENQLMEVNRKRKKLTANPKLAMAKKESDYAICIENLFSA